MPELRLSVAELNKENAQRFEEAIGSVPGVERVDTWRGGALIVASDDSALVASLKTAQAAGFKARLDGDGVPSGESTEVRHLKVDGMTCHACEINIERGLRKIDGILKVDADAARGTVRIVCQSERLADLDPIKNVLKEKGYSLRDVRNVNDRESSITMERPSMLRLLWLFAVVLVAGAALTRLGLLGTSPEIGQKAGFLAALFVGLVAGTSSCLAVSGGLLLSSAAKFNARCANASPAVRMRPVFLFVAGRVASYGLLGGIIGAAGKALSPSPAMTGIITALAAVYMLVMGLDMLGMAPGWLKRLLPRLPKSWSHRIMDAEGKTHPAAPFLLGAATFFIPCGFTQAFQLYALASGNFLAGASTLAGFALGTAPALLALGWASSSFKGKLGKIFFQFSGATVIMLGLWNIGNGLTVAGYPLPRLTLGGGENAAAAEADGAPPIIDGKQVIKMTVGGTEAAYDPDNFTVRAGVPVRWEITAVRAGGCLSSLIAPKFGVRTLLKKGSNVVTFTPEQPGNYSFSCGMGMFRGRIAVVQ